MIHANTNLSVLENTEVEHSCCRLTIKLYSIIIDYYTLYTAHTLRYYMAYFG